MTYKTIFNDGSIYYGKHLIINATRCNDNQESIDFIRNWIINMCDEIDMQRFGDCHVHRFGHGDEVGISAFQLIFTSNISMHTNDKYRDMYVDVFSCKDYDCEVVLNLFEKSFKPEDINHKITYRE